MKKSKTNQKRVNLLAALLGMFFLWGCTKSTTVEHENDESEFIELNSQGQVVLLGARTSGDSSWAKFTYNFKMLRHEVTLKQFGKMMGYYPISQSSAIKDDVPVTEVNLYEAVLFCNALSKAAGFDTVFRYTETIWDASGHLKYAENLSADLSKDGYRLPTEAEWNFAAGGYKGNVFPWGIDSNDVDQFAWTSENSAGTLQPIERKNATDGGFFDLAGNALEMVWGWYGAFPKDTVTNFAGATNVGGKDEIAVKGGSAFHSRQFTKLQSRKDVYSTYVSSKLKYMGFRIVRGAIPKATYTDANGEMEYEASFSIVSSRKQVLDFFGTSKVKLVFIDNMNKKLTTVDFQKITPVTNIYKSDLEIVNPSISPDGMSIAFGTRYEGQSGKSDAYVVPFLLDSVPNLISPHSAYKPRWHKNYASGGVSIVVADSGISNGDSSSWKNGKTYSISWPSKEERVLSERGSFHSGFSRDERYLVTGYTKLLRDDLKKGVIEQLFLSPENGKDADGSAQVCNVSLRPERSSEILFLDFGYARKSSVIGRAYGIHEILFSANVETGTVEKYFVVPEGYLSWDHSIWSTHPDFIVTSVVDNTDYHTAIYAIRYRDGAVIKLIEGGDIVMPHLWVDSTATESAPGETEEYGRYDEPNIVENQAWTGKLLKFWEGIDTIDAFIFGTSREYGGINPMQMTGYTILNMGAPFLGPHPGMDFARDYLLNRKKLPRLLIIGLGPEYMANSMITKYSGTLGQTPGYAIDKAHGFWTDSLPSSAREFLIENARNGNSGEYWRDSLGYFYNPNCNGWGDPVISIDASWSGGPADWIDGWQRLKNFVQIATGKGIKVVTLILPMNPAYRNTPYYSRHGGLRKEVLAFLDSVKTLETGNSNFRHLDFHHDGNHDFSDENATDSDHLCSVGASRVTDSIMARIKDWN